MKKTILATLIVLVCGLWAVAQQSDPGQSSSGQAAGSAAQTTIQGCLSGSDGKYTLTDKSGTAYQLTGDTAKLSDHVGHEIQIKGKVSPPSTPPSASAATAQQTLDVTSVKHVSATCGSKSSDSPKSEKPPMSENPPTPRL